MEINTTLQVAAMLVFIAAGLSGFRWMLTGNISDLRNAIWITVGVGLFALAYVLLTRGFV